jgi:K+-transporting ATPase KdpF subunit
LNLVIAPAVFAATGDEITRKAAYALGILGIVTLGVAIYLFAVILQPERF